VEFLVEKHVGFLEEKPITFLTGISQERDPGHVLRTGPSWSNLPDCRADLVPDGSKEMIRNRSLYHRQIVSQFIHPQQNCFVYGQLWDESPKLSLAECYSAETASDSVSA
jgi:hypothetical protein